MAASFDGAIRNVGWGIVILTFAIYFPDVSFEWFTLKANTGIEATRYIQLGMLVVAVGFMSSPLFAEVFEDD